MLLKYARKCKAPTDNCSDQSLAIKINSSYAIRNKDLVGHATCVDLVSEVLLTLQTYTTDLHTSNILHYRLTLQSGCKTIEERFRAMEMLDSSSDASYIASKIN